MFFLTYAHAGPFQPAQWYIVGRETGCNSMSEMYKDFPYFEGARTPQEWLDKVLNAPTGADILFLGKAPVDAELKPFTEFIKQVRPDAELSKDAPYTKTNAVVLVSKKDAEGGLIFFRGDLCAMVYPESK